MAAKILRWIDEKSVLKLDGKIYSAGDKLPAGKIPSARLTLFKNLKMIEVESNADSPEE